MPSDAGPIRPIVFLHLPKTAGMTLRGVLEHVYAGHPIAFLGNLSKGGELAEFAARPEADRRAHALVAGHFPWGSQVVLPGARTITVLRDPVERLISVYAYNKRAPNALHHHAINEGNLSLADCVESGLLKGEYNLQTNMLRDKRATTPDQALASAKRNIRACAAFGLVERFDETLAYLASELRWPADAIDPDQREDRNVTANRAKADDLEPSLLETLRRETAIDRALYDDATDLFNKRTAG